MTFTTVAIGLAIMVAVALLMNYRRGIRAGITAIGTGIRTIRYGDITTDPLNWMAWYLRTHMIPLRLEAQQITDARQRADDRALTSVRRAEDAFPGGAPSGVAAVAIFLGLGCWIIVAIANGVLDWSLNLAFTRGIFQATMLTLLTVSAPLLLANLAQAALRRRPDRTADDGERTGSWSVETFRSAIIGLVVVYMILFAAMGYLGMTRAERVFEDDTAQTMSAYDARSMDINSTYDEQIRKAQLTQTQDVGDGADAAQQQSDGIRVTNLQNQKQAELEAAASDRDTTLANLQNSKAGDAKKWIGFAVAASMLESVSAFTVKNGIMLSRLVAARRRKQYTADKLASARAGEARVNARIIARMARILAGAHVPAETFDAWLRTSVLHPGPEEPAIDGGTAPPTTPDPPDVIEEPIEPTPTATDEGEADDPTPGFSEA